LADVDRVDPGRATHGYPRLNPCASGAELSARGNADGGGAGSARRG